MSRLKKAKTELDNKSVVGEVEDFNETEEITQTVEVNKPRVETPEPEIKQETNKSDAVKPAEPATDPSERTYVLRMGKTAQFPIRFPNGQVITVKFEDGMKKLSGRLSNLFHAEYLANPSLRAKCSIVDATVADNVARQHRKANPRVANPGLDSANMSPAMKETMLQDAQMRHMQRRAAENATVEIQLPHELKTELGT